jgi:hypothetical protein
MIVERIPYYYDVVCDRCGFSLAKRLFERFGRQGDIRFLRDCFSVEILEHFHKHRKGHPGWRYNKNNKTIFCPKCKMIINKKGDKK